MELSTPPSSNRETNFEDVRRTMVQQMKRRLESVAELNVYALRRYLNEKEYQETLIDFYSAQSRLYLVRDADGRQYADSVVYRTLSIFEERKLDFLIHSLLYTMEIQ